MPCPKGGSMIRGDDLRRFWSKTREENGCIVWTGTRHHYGHGKFMTGPAGAQRTNRAHRWIYAQTVGPVDGVILRHSCDNPPCVNVAHLVVGTQLDNVHDAMDRGRRPSVGLSAVMHIREAFANGDSVAAIAHRLVLNYQTVYGIARRLTWKHV